MTTPYDDIIDLPHHVSANHPQMSMHDRAAQFSPFAALVGYDDAVDETARLTDQKIELDETEKAELDRRLAFLVSKLDEQPVVSIEYFVPDERKSGGKYVIVSGVVKKFSSAERTITMSDGRIIRIADILTIAGTLFDAITE